tara:strand:- start:47970 stop:48977 length:1008 start_codon:yes stop_codon:yes gene_type:complete
MRLAQIARKVGLTPIEVKRFLESEFKLSIGNEPNYKLDENQINSVLEKFPIPVKELKTPEVKKADEEIIPEMDNALQEIEEVVEETVAEEIEVTTTEKEVIEEAETPVIEAESMETPEIEIELVEEVAPAVEISYEDPTEDFDADAPFVEAAVDREADLIKVPTVKLDGLKVLGKIELPEKKEEEVVVKSEDDIAQEEADAIAALDAAMELNAQDIKPATKASIKESKETKEHFQLEETYSEYKDDRGFYHFSLQQKLSREKALIQIELESKREFEKEKKKRHYEEVMKERKQKESVVPSKAKQKKIETRKQKREEKNIEPAKGIWAKFLRWLND